jgi:hypothetical protein
VPTYTTLYDFVNSLIHGWMVPRVGLAFVMTKNEKLNDSRPCLTRSEFLLLNTEAKRGARRKREVR